MFLRPLSSTLFPYTTLFRSVLESAMPTMVTAAALAISHRMAPRLAAALVGYGIVLAMATLPAWNFVLQRLRSEEHTSELQSRPHLVCRLLLEKKNTVKCQDG